jgi:hypothetical protein
MLVWFDVNVLFARSSLLGSHPEGMPRCQHGSYHKPTLALASTFDV